MLPRHPTVAAITDAVAADLDEQGIGTVHVLGNSIGARVALELAARGRAGSVVVISPSGLNTAAERAYQGVLMGTNRLALRRLRPLVPLAARTVVGRTLLLAGLRSRPWLSSEVEAPSLRDGFADAHGSWEMLWWGILTDVPTGLDRIDCPVVLAQGTADAIASGRPPASWPPSRPRASCRCPAPDTPHSPTLPSSSCSSSSRRPPAPPAASAGPPPCRAPREPTPAPRPVIEQR
jgi:pimeloyl-ACP methyl ester carboxylesterase